MNDLERDDCMEDFEIEVHFKANAVEPSPTAQDIEDALMEGLAGSFVDVRVKVDRR